MHHPNALSDSVVMAVSVANGNKSGTPSAYLEHLKDLRSCSETTTPHAHLQILKERLKISRYMECCVIPFLLHLVGPGKSFQHMVCLKRMIIKD